MINKILIIALIFLNYTYTQNYNFAKYKCVIHLSDDAREVDKKFGLISKAEEIVDDVEFTLYFSNSESSFQIESEDQFDKMSIQMLKAVTKTNGKIYTNLTENIFLKEIVHSSFLKEIYGNEKHIIVDSVYNNWKVFDEYKIINGFKCYKAEYISIKKILERSETLTAIAWFCPEIPVSFGPAEFSGLPGLIFQLQTNQYSFILERLDEKNNFLINRPKDGKILVLEDYLKMSANKMKELSEMAKTFKE